MWRDAEQQLGRGVQPPGVTNSSEFAGELSRRRIAENLLSNTRASLRLLQEWNIQDKLELLNYEGLSDLLRSNIVDQSLPHSIRKVSIEVAEACCLADLSSILVDLALDESEHYDLRISSAMSITKTDNEVKTIYFQLKNEESYTFYNVTISNSDIINMPKIDKIDSGVTVNVTANIETNDNFDGNLKIRGEYFENIGSSNKTYDLNIDYNSGISNCEISIIKGDSIKWYK